MRTAQQACEHFVPMTPSAANVAHLDRCVNCGERHDPVARTESDLHAAYVAGEIKRAEYVTAVAELHAVRCAPGVKCVCLACREVAAQS